MYSMLRFRLIACINCPIQILAVSPSPETARKFKSLFSDEIPIKLTKKKFNHNAYFDEVDSFSRTILYRKPQVISLEDSKKNIKAITGLLDSAKSGKLISIKK